MGSEKLEKPRYFCQECNKELKPGQKPCPYCNSNKILIKMSPFRGTLFLRGGLRGRQKRKGIGGYIRDLFTGWQESGDKKKYPEGVIKGRLIDRIGNIYREKVKDVKTGKTTRDIEKPLSEHGYTKGVKK